MSGSADPTLWPYRPHTRAKHQLLRRYLDAWLPILGSRQPKIVIVDGFAGPGRYSTGEEGSPLIMLRALREHSARDRLLASTRLVFVFIEERQDRYDHLCSELALVEPLENTEVHPVHGTYTEAFADLVSQSPTLAPMFLFIDPFGWADNHIVLSSAVLQHPRCEVLHYVPFPNIARFVIDEAIAPSLVNLYGDRSWEAARAVEGEERRRLLHDLFIAALTRSVPHVRSFEVAYGAHGYHMVFGTANVRGMERMKDAMWNVDPKNGVQYDEFRDTTTSGQTVLFGPSPDFHVLDRLVREHFAAATFRIQDAEDFVTLRTPFRKEHLREGVLQPAERRGQLVVGGPRKKRGTYPPGTVIRFADGEVG